MEGHGHLRGNVSLPLLAAFLPRLPLLVIRRLSLCIFLDSNQVPKVRRTSLVVERVHVYCILFRLSSVIFFTNLKNDLNRPRYHYQGDVERGQQVRVLQGIRQRACEQSPLLPAKQDVAAPSEGMARRICVASIATT